MTEPEPCRRFPDDATYKTIGLGPCPRCGARSCWRRYLSWEKSLGIDLNEPEPPNELDEDHRERAESPSYGLLIHRVRNQLLERVLRCLDNNNETQAIALLRAYEAVK